MPVVDPATGHILHPGHHACARCGVGRTGHADMPGRWPPGICGAWTPPPRGLLWRLAYAVGRFLAGLIAGPWGAR